MNLTLVSAQETQISNICDLVNLSYRGEMGWTKETHLVSGNRVEKAEILNYLADGNAHLFVALENGKVVACVCVEEKTNAAYIGLFAVHPKLQGRGLGKSLLAQAENYAATTLDKKQFIMLVVSKRKELIEYYERRGYVKTGETEAYPTDINVGVPVQADLTIEYLKKSM